MTQPAALQGNTFLSDQTNSSAASAWATPPIITWNWDSLTCRWDPLLIKVASSVRNRNLRRCMHAGKQKQVGEETTQFGKSSRQFHPDVWSWCLNSTLSMRRNTNKMPPVIHICAKCAQRTASFVYVRHLRRPDTMQALSCGERILLAAWNVTPALQEQSSLLFFVVGTQRSVGVLAFAIQRLIEEWCTSILGLAFFVNFCKDEIWDLLATSPFENVRLLVAS